MTGRFSISNTLRTWDTRWEESIRNAIIAFLTLLGSAAHAQANLSEEYKAARTEKAIVQLTHMPVEIANSDILFMATDILKKCNTLQFNRAAVERAVLTIQGPGVALAEINEKVSAIIGLGMSSRGTYVSADEACELGLHFFGPDGQIVPDVIQPK